MKLRIFPLVYDEVDCWANIRRCPTCNRAMGRVKMRAHAPTCQGPTTKPRQEYTARTKRVRAAVKAELA